MYAQFKSQLSEIAHLSRDALHIHIGLAVFLAIAALGRFRWRWCVGAWAVLLLLELGNEVLDILHGVRHGEGVHLRGNVKDLVNTMLWPSLLLIALRMKWIPLKDPGTQGRDRP